MATEAGGVGIWDYDATTNALVWDDQMFRLYGITRARFSGAYEAWSAGLHPDDRQRAEAELQQALREEKEFNMEFRVLWPDGTVRNIHALARVQRNITGQPVRMLGTNWDITEIKHAEDALAAETMRRRMLFEQSPDGCVILDPQTARFLEFNTAAHQQLGYSCEEFAQLTVMDVEVNETAAESRARIDEVIRCGKADAETRQRTRQGELRDVHVTAQIVQVLSRPVYYCIWRDITARKQTETLLIESEANFRTFFESMTDMIVVGTPDGRILFTNAAVPRTLGYSPEELAGMRLLDLHPADKRLEAETIVTAMFRGERSSCPLPLGRKDGGLVPAETRVWFGRWDGQDCIFGISKNLTAEQDAQQRFERLFRNNPTVMALSSLPDRRFTDVNDTFLKTLGYSRGDIIGKTTDDIALFVHPEQQVAVANTLEKDGLIVNFELQVRCKNGTVLDGLFSGDVISSQGQNYFLTVMVDITERMRFQPRSTDVVALCHDVVARVQTAFPKHPPLHFETTAPALRTLADVTLVERVLSNLLTNAFKYSPALTPVRFSVRCVGEEWEMQVQDHGIGILEADQATLFSAFRRGGNVGNLKGTGVGLYITKKCAELHGGRVVFRSQAGQGSTFLFAFPWRPAETTRSEAL